MAAFSDLGKNRAHAENVLKQPDVSVGKDRFGLGAAFAAGPNEV